MKKIVLIEDEKYLVDIYLKKLENDELRLFAFMVAEEAEETIEKEKPDLIILDILLPKEDGLSFLKRLREKGNNTPVIVLSNFEGKSYRQRAKELNAKAYYLKTDYTPSQVAELIKQNL
jgi:DNA-binding response OmpR family regulator